ncbi:MAG: hypothetical protein H6819_09955 [Phycisphaerales bacterium]|nr:hypothetical protein [Phycisphaerales bacterium]MCB9857972.1 hypothetical protein [Phycisphaerales bacterium]MCB9864935.1 hypothetical protein [Phycisphaerales bacterium]
MTQIIARLVLAMLILPFAMIIMATAFAVDVAIAGRPEFEGILVGWIITDLFVVVYWIAIWRSSIRWTQRRVASTLGAVGGGAFAAMLGIGALRHLIGIPIEPATMFGNSLFPLVFVLASVFIWRETAAERFERMRGRGVDTVACPICGYNMTGLREARCPECGVVFTLDELLSAQSQEQRDDVPDH